MTIDGQGIHAVMKNENGYKNNMTLKMFNISSGKVEVDSKFPTETSAFLGLSPSNIRFYSTGESGKTVRLQLLERCLPN